MYIGYNPKKLIFLFRIKLVNQYQFSGKFHPVYAFFITILLKSIGADASISVDDDTEFPMGAAEGGDLTTISP